MSRQAVVIGTNYEGASYELSGCVNDAVDWAELLGSEGYAVTSLVAEAATRENIVGALVAAVSVAGRGDRIVVTYSGHGTWLPDTTADEVDGRDEAWCPDNMQSAGLLTDDDLAAIFGSARAGVGMLVLSDSCYSGSVTRLVQPPGSARYLSPEVALGRELPVEVEDEARLPLFRAYTAHASLISGCGEHEVSYDAWFDDRANGAFTRAAIDTCQSGIDLAGWERSIRSVLPSAEYPQSPVLTAANLYRRYTRAL